jgi:hypothetical protein
VNLSTVRDDLKARLGTISGLTVYDTMPGSPEVPCAIVYPTTIVVHASFERGCSDVRFAVQVLVQMADWASAQDALDSYISIGTATSVIDALEGFTTGAEDVTVETVEDYGTVDFGEVTFGGVTFNAIIRMSS